MKLDPKNHEDLVFHPCRVCRELGPRSRLVTCARCGSVLCLTCAAGAGCPRGEDHAPPGWSVRTATGVWACGPRFWPGRQLQARGVPVHLQGLYVLPDLGGPPRGTLQLLVEAKGPEWVPPDLRAGQPVQLLVNGWAILGGAAEAPARHAGGMLVQVQAAAGGVAEGSAWRTRTAPRDGSAT